MKYSLMAKEFNQCLCTSHVVDITNGLSVQIIPNTSMILVTFKTMIDVNSDSSTNFNRVTECIKQIEQVYQTLFEGKVTDVSAHTLGIDKEGGLYRTKLMFNLVK